MDVAAGHQPGRGKYAKRDRQIERRACLPQVGRGKVHGDMVLGELEPRVANRAANAVAALANADVRQPHHGKCRQPE